MGKNARVKEQHRLEKEQNQIAAARRKKRRRIIGVITAATALLAAVAVVIAVVFGVLRRNGTLLRRGISMETAHFQVTDQMMSYYIYSLYENYRDQYGDQLSLSDDLPLQKQMFREDVSWFDYFALEARSNLRQILLFAEKAQEQGVTLTDEEKKEIDSFVETADISAYQSLTGFNREDFRQTMLLTSLASKMFAQTTEQVAVGEQEIADYYEQHADYFRPITYKVITLPYGENGWFPAAESAKAMADSLARAKTAEEYDKYAKQILSAIGASSSEIETELEEASQSGVYTDDDKFSEWAYADGRKALDIYVQDTGSAYAVYQLLTLPQRDETQKYNVRHILLTADTYGSDAKARAKAEQLLAEWKAGEATDESFGKLAEEYSEDESSRSTGGLYKNVGAGETETNFDSWCFDSARRPGDTGVIKTSYGLHVMYFVGPGQKQWEQSVEAALLNEKVDELCAEYQKTWPVTINERHIDRLPL